MMDKTFLDKAYDVDGQDGINQLYADWAASYDAEVKSNGYATPGRIAKALGHVIDDKSVAVLDYGCGTGLSGKALRSHGFSNLTGADPSAEMLAIAKADAIYSDLVQIDIEAGPPFEAGQFPVIAAIGVIGAGAAPVEVFDALFSLLTVGQKFTLSLNDHTLEVAEFPERVSGVVSRGEAKLIFEEYGDHLPGQNMKSMIYILEKI